MTTQDIIDRIRKLRRLATSSNEHEAATAAAIADKLIQEHRLEEAAIEGEEHSTSIPVEEDPEFFDLGKRINSWQWYLYTRLISHYDVAGYSSWRKGHRTLHMIGRKDDVEIVKFQCFFFTTEINRLALHIASGQGRTALHSFRMGAVVGILEALREAKAAAMAQANTSTAMVLSNRKKEADDFLNAKFPKMKNAQEPSTNIRDGLMYARGVSAGKKMSPPKKELGE